MGEEALLARELELDRAAGRAREQRRDDLEVERLGAMAEAAADEGLDHADRRLVEREAARQRQVHVVGHLRHRVQRQPAALGVPLGERGVGLHHRVRDFRVVEALLAHEVGRAEPGIRVAEHLLHLALDVAGLVGVQQHRVRRARRRGVEVRGQRLEVQHDRVERRPRGRRVDGRDRGHRLAAIAHALARERELVLGDRNDAVGDVAVLAGDDGGHARHRARRGHVDAANPGVRGGASQDRADQRAGRGQVRGIARATGDLLDAVDQRLAYSYRMGPHVGRWRGGAASRGGQRAAWDGPAPLVPTFASSGLMRAPPRPPARIR